MEKIRTRKTLNAESVENTARQDHCCLFGTYHDFAWNEKVNAIQALQYDVRHEGMMPSGLTPLVVFL